MPDCPFPQMPAHEYHADPFPEGSLSSSIAHILTLDSPQHAYRAHPRLGGKPSIATPEQEQGSHLHSLLLGRGPEFVVFEADNWRTKASQEFRDAARAGGAIPLLVDQAGELFAAAELIRQNLASEGYVIDKDDRRNEVCATWKERADDGTDVQCRALIDHFDGSKAVDLKFVKKARPSKLGRKYEDFGYHIQSVAYERAIAARIPELAGHPASRTAVVFCEVAEPFFVVPSEPDGTMHALGEMLWRRAVNTWAQCMRTKQWPGYGPFPVRVAASPWALAAEEAELDE